MPILKPGGGTFDGGGASGDWITGKGVSDDTVSFVMNDGKKRLAEASTFLSETIGGTGNFQKIAANAKSFVHMNALVVRAEGMKAGDQTGAPLPINKDALADLSKLSVRSSEATATASQVKAATGASANTSSHKVILEEKLLSDPDNSIVIFEVLPEIVEQHTVEYEALAPPQFPGAFQKYKGNSSTQWQLNAMFVSRNSAEAAQNYKYLMTLRGWTKPFYGKRTSATYPGRLGAPPPTLMLSGLRNLIGPVPVVITSLNWSWPKDVDYVSTGIPGPDGKPIPFPTILSVPIQLVESFSIDQFNQFSLEDYRKGNLTAAFNDPKAQAVKPGGKS